MSPSKKSSRSSVSLRTRTYHDGYSNFYLNRPQCALKNCNQKKSSTAVIEEEGPIIHSREKCVPSNSSNPSTSCSSLNQGQVSTSKNISDTQHRRSTRPKALEFQPACLESFELGTPMSFLGNCAVNDIGARQISNKDKFSLTEDPRKRFCLRNSMASRAVSADEELINVIDLVKTAENLSTSSDSEASTSSICEVIDLTNPLNLDFQGMDYKTTYERDEQACQNQIEYRKVRRFKHRRNVKVQTAISTEKELQEERISIPKHFALNKPSAPSSGQGPEVEKEKEVFGKLIRTEQKPEVRQRLDEEEKNRRERYKQLYIRRKQKLAQREEEEIAKQKAATENKAKILAEKDIQDLVCVLDRTVTTKKMELRQIPTRRDYPHTLAEARKFRHQLKKSKRILRDRAKVKQEFYAQKGKQKLLPEAELKISSDSSSLSPADNEKSTDDEDDMIVGQKGSKFLLRGFHYKLGSNLRGKFQQKELTIDENKIKGCITREEWFETLVPSKKNVPTNFQHPAASAMELFPRELGVKQPQAKSAIGEFRRKQLGRHYDRVVRRNLRIKKPKRIKVRKFNMIRYLYGIGGKKKTSESLISLEDDVQHGGTVEYMRNKAKIEKVKREMKDRRRMHYLGIPCDKTETDNGTTSICVDSDSEDSDWIPEDTSMEALSTERLDLRSRGNMPAPEYRETTLRRHPRHPRDYERLRVPSELFDDFVCKNNIPVMKTLENDKNVVENVRVKNTEYASMFEARHHHDHWNPTQHKTARIRYSIKIVRPKPMEEKP